VLLLCVSLATARSQRPACSQQGLAPHQGECLDARDLWADVGRRQGHCGALFISGTIIPIAAVVLYLSPYDKLYPYLWFLTLKLSPVLNGIRFRSQFPKAVVKTTWFQTPSKAKCISAVIKKYIQFLRKNMELGYLVL
jgi:hypothetical protein